MRKNYVPGTNSRGLPQKRYADVPSRTKRGQGRAERREARRHQHEFKKIEPARGTSYGTGSDGDRVDRESYFMCVKVVGKRKYRNLAKYCGYCRPRLAAA